MTFRAAMDEFCVESQVVYCDSFKDEMLLLKLLGYIGIEQDNK